MITLQDIYDALPDDCINEICQSGNNEDACEWWVQELDMNLSNGACHRLIKQSGCELDTDDNFRLNVFVIWLAAWDGFDRQNDDTFIKAVEA